MSEKRSRKVLCPECETEVIVTRDDDGDDNGVCEKCGLNVGRLLTKRRYDTALGKMIEQEKKEAEKNKPAPKKKSSILDW